MCRGLRPSRRDPFESVGRRPARELGLSAEDFTAAELRSVFGNLLAGRAGKPDTILCLESSAWQ
eukprot:4335690-Pyramimonas_sp.AAC.1